MELIVASPAAKISSTMDDNQIPPLLSMVIEGLPALQLSKYTEEAEKLLKQYVSRWQKIDSFDSYCRVGLSYACYVHPGVVDVDRLLAITLLYGIYFVVDDLLIDSSPNEYLLGQYGIDRSVCESPRKIEEYHDHLDAVLSQKEAPQINSAIEVIVWEMGHKFLEMSNPEWFGVLVASAIEFHHASAGSHAEIVAGENSCVEVLELYTTMRAANAAGKLIQVLAEFASNVYLPCEIRAHPYIQKITTAASIHIGFSNDIYSYHKEISLEENPRNLITLFMKSEGMPRVQAMHAAFQLVNEYAHTILDLESAAWNSALQLYLKDIKEVIAGNVYFGCFDERYRQPDSIFLEQRDMTVTWKACPHNIQ